MGNAHVQHGRNDPREQSAPDPKAEGIEKWQQQIRSMTELRPAQGLGQLVISDAQSDSPVRLDVQQYHVNVVLKPPVALVQIDQSFFNPYGSQEEGTFVCNLPSGSSVSRFAMYVTPESLIEGELIERKQADEVSMTIVLPKRDPAILKQIGDNLFRMRVFPIFARDTKRILLDYTVPLVAAEGQYRFQLPLMSDRKPIQNFSLTGTIHPPFTPDSVRSPSHPEIRFTVDKNQTVTFQLSQKEVNPPPYFTLSYSATAQAEPTVRAYQEPTDKDRFFVVTVPESKRPVISTSENPCDLLLLIETSGNAQLPRARQLARAVISGMSPNDRLQIGCVDVKFRSLTTNWCRADSPEANQALQRLSEQLAIGMNDLATSLPQARAVFSPATVGRRQIIVYVGDGPSRALPNFVDQKAEPVQGVTEPLLFAIAATSDEFLAVETRRSGGILFDLNTSHARHSLFQWSLSRFPAPILVRSVKIAGVENHNVFHDHIWPIGGELQITGKAPPQDVLQITLTAGTAKHTEELTFNVDCRTTAADVFTGRLWARHKVDALMRNSNVPVSVRDRDVVQLCQEWSLMSPLTAFLVLETEQDYGRWKIDRKTRRRYWKPVGSEVARVDVDPPKQPIKLKSSIDLDQERLVRRIVKEIESKLADHDTESAIQILHRLEHETESNSDALQKARQLVDTQLKPKQRLVELSTWRPLVDRRVAEVFVSPVPLLTRFPYRIADDFLKRHPHAYRLLRKVGDLQGETSLSDFADLIQKLTGLPVFVDRQAIADEGIDLDVSIDLNNVKGMSVRALMKNVLEEHGLKFIPERHLLRITAINRDNGKMISYVYPVDDLLPGGALPSSRRMANPYFDAEEKARQRIEAILNESTEVSFNQNPLNEILKYFSDLHGLPVRIDHKSLKESGDGNPNSGTVELTNVPFRVALDEVLKPLDLTAVICNECLKVTTRWEADKTLETRMYSLVGLEDPPKEDTPARWVSAFRYCWGRITVGSGESFDVGPANTESNDPSVPVDDDDDFKNSLVPDETWISRTQNALQSSTTGKWFKLDREGGSIVYVAASHAIMVQQTQQVHSDISNLLEQQRQAISPHRVLNRRPRNPTFTEMGYLQDIVEQSTNARWINRDFEGGSITCTPKNAMTILQTQDVHEEIDRIFTQLRRSRFITETASSRTFWNGIDDLSAADVPAVTPLPRNSVMLRSEKRNDEMQWLASRKVPAGINQRWRSIATQARRPVEFQLRKRDSRLELTLPDRILRCDGPSAVVVYPGLALGEINDWGDAARLQVDFALPWLPHRSNDELAVLFDVSRVSEDANQITLRLGFPGFTDSYLEMTISKPTGQPTKWIAVVTNQTQFELKFEPQRVMALDAQGALLESWELLADDAPKQIPALT